MRSKLFIISAAFMLKAAYAQDPTALAVSPTLVASAPTSYTSPATPTVANSTASEYTQISIIDYKSVYEAATLEEEVQMATERFKLTKSQQEVWETAATDRRETEKQTRAALESKSPEYNKNAVYQGLRSAQTQFYETIIGYLEPSQKQLIERDRVITEEKRKMIAKLPPPVTTPTVAPVDSTAIKAEMQKMEKDKKAKAKSKKKKKPIGT